MKIKFHGAAQEVGRSCIEVESKGKKFLLDCGLKLSEKGTEFPKTVKDYNFDAVFISHAHLDHTGSLPLFDANGMNCPIFTTEMTKKIAKILLKDAFKIGKINHTHLGYGKDDIRTALGWMRRVRKLEKGSIEGIKYEFFEAGHIPGSASIVLDVDGTKVAYTGDINTTETRLMNGANIDYASAFGPIDVLIAETTYGDREHSDRKTTEKQFLTAIEKTLQRGGSAIVPVFAVGRSQEILLLLADKKFDVPIYLDGMSIKVTQTVLEIPASVRDGRKLDSALRKVKIVKGWKERRDIVKTRGIFVTTSGMLTGGPIIDYLKHHYFDKKSSILMTGYQGEGTNGRNLLESGFVYLEGMKTKVQCEVKQFDFSAHAGLSQIKSIVQTVKPKTLVLNHGDPKAITTLYDWAKSLGIRVEMPTLGETITI